MVLVPTDEETILLFFQKRRLFWLNEKLPLHAKTAVHPMENGPGNATAAANGIP